VVLLCSGPPTELLPGGSENLLRNVQDLLKVFDIAENILILLYYSRCLQQVIEHIARE